MTLLSDRRRALYLHRLLWSSLGLAAAGSLVTSSLCAAQHSIDTLPGGISARHTFRGRRSTLVSPSSAVGFVVAGIGLVMVAGVFIYGLCARPGGDGDQDDEEDMEEEAALAEDVPAVVSEQAGCPSAPLLHM